MNVVMIKIVNVFVCVLIPFMFAACTSVPEATTGFRYDSTFGTLLKPDGTLAQEKLSAVVVRPALRHVDLLGGFGNRQPEAENEEVENVNYASFFNSSGGLGIVYGPNAKCGFSINAPLILDQVQTDKPLLDIGLTTSAEYFPATAAKIPDAILKQPINLKLENDAAQCLKSQGRYVLLLRHDQMSEIDYLKRKTDGFWDKYKQDVVRQALRGPQPAIQWNILNFVIIDTSDSRVLARGDSWNQPDGPNVENIPWGIGYRKGLSKTFDELAKTYHKAVQAQ